jgi:hypothetical protein
LNIPAAPSHNLPITSNRGFSFIFFSKFFFTIKFNI